MEGTVVTGRIHEINQMEALGAPLPNAPRMCGRRSQGGKGPGEQESISSGSEGQPEGRPYSPSAPMDTSLTPLLAMKSRALLTLEILCTRILPRSGLARRSPECMQTKSGKGKVR